MLQKKLPSRTNGHGIERAKIEIRERGKEPDGKSAELEGAELRTTLERLLATDQQAEVRHEFARVQAERESTVALLRAVVSMSERLSRVETLITELHELAKNATPTKEWYTVKELAEILGKAEFTVREWCRLGRVNAAKRDCGRGNSQEWIVSHEELLRLQNEGLLAE